MGVFGADSGDDESGNRAQSSVIGVVLIIAITVAGVTGIMLFGATALENATTQSEINTAEHAMTQLDSRFSLVALGSAEHHSTTVDLQSGASMRVDGDSGWINVSVVNRSTGVVDDTVLNTSLGAVVYENDGTSIAYQGGGIWREAPSGGSEMVSPPEFHYRRSDGDDPTLTLPLVVVRGNGSISERASVSKDGTTAKFPIDGNPNRMNPLPAGVINVTVHSDYYDAWGSFFEERTGGKVSYRPDRNEVTITLVVEDSESTVGGGIVSSAAGSSLSFGNQGTADSYNSSGGGDYASTKAQNTSIIAAGDVTLGQSTNISGDLTAGGSVTMDQKAEVTGNVSYGGTADIDSKAVIGGTVSGDAQVTPPSAVDWLIDLRRNQISDSNNNSLPAIDGSHRLTGCVGGCTLYAGNYYLDEMEVGNGEELILDTTSGDVNVVVDGDADLQQGTVRVTGNNRARVYLEGDLFLRQSNVTVPNERAPGLWFYMNPGASVPVFKQTRFVGVIYGPGDGAQSGVDIQIATDNDVFGGLVGVPSSIGQTTKIHFDEALTAEDPHGTYGKNKPTVTYMHVTVNRVNVSSR